MAKIPLGGQLYIVNGAQYLVYDAGYGVKVWYSIPDIETLQQMEGLPPGQTVSPEQFSQILGRNINGGLVQELFDSAKRFPPGASYSFLDWLNKELEIYAAGADWVYDPEVRQIYIDYLLNQERISEGDLRTRIRQTNWWKQRTTAEAAWDGLSPAEQNQRIQSTAVMLAEQYLRTVGEAKSPSDPEIQRWAREVASGAKGQTQVLGEMRERALQNPESPWAREVRGFEESARQRAIDISNTANTVRQRYLAWGVPFSEDALQKWATDIETNTKSSADLESWLRGQAQVLYPWKDPNVETSLAAEPWLQTYARVLERAAPSLFDPYVQRALTSGMPVYQFEQYLKSQPEWLYTKNAKLDLAEAAFRAGQLMGFE